MIVCPKCGKDVTVAGAYCPWCSAPLRTWSQGTGPSTDTQISASTDSLSDGNAILQIAQELSASLGLVQLKVTRVIWAENYHRHFAFPDSPSFLGEVLLLSSKIKGRLVKEEWNALLAAAIIYDNRLRLGRRLGRLTILIGVVLAVVVTAWISSVISSVLYPSQSCQTQSCSRAAGKVLAPIDLFLLIGALYLVLAITAPGMRHLRYKADRLTAKDLGLRDSLIEALTKIDSLGVEPGFAHLTKIAHNPSPPDRVRSLAKVSNLSLPC